MKIAVTTTDGVNVNQHFGKADSFYIYEVKNGELKNIEKRDVKPYCDSGSDTMPDPNHNYSVDKLLLAFEVIKDCKILYTQQIGKKPEQGLHNMGITVKLCNCPIESVVGCSGECK